jgi:hypothetical protein
MCCAVLCCGVVWCVIAGSFKVHAARYAFNTAALAAALNHRSTASASASASSASHHHKQHKKHKPHHHSSQWQGDVHSIPSAQHKPVQSEGQVVTPFVYPLYKQCNSSWGNEMMQTQTICVCAVFVCLLCSAFEPAFALGFGSDLLLF